MDTIDSTSENPQNFLETDFQLIFRNVYSLQHALGSCRVSIKNNLVTPPTVLQKCYTIICMTLTFASSYVIVPALLAFTPDRTFTTLSLMVMCSIYITSFSNVIHTRFVNGHENADFLIKLHNLDILMKFEKRKELNALLKQINAFAVYTIVLTFIFVTVMGFVAFQLTGFILIVWTIYLVSFILEIVVCSGIVIFFFVRVRFVNLMIESYLKRDENVRKPIILSKPSLKLMGFVADDTNNYFATSDIHNYLKEILSCFTMFQNLYRFQLLLFCIKLVVISLMSFELMLYLVSRNIINSISQLIVLVIFIIIDMFIASFLAIRFGLFFSEVKETKRFCIAVMAIHHDDGPMREKAKTMLNIIEETPPRFSIYDMWDMNAGTLLSILSLVTSLIVTLIQFEFL